MRNLSNSYKEMLSHGDELFARLGLRSFILDLPLRKRDSSLENGIRRKIHKNFSYSCRVTGKEAAFHRDDRDVRGMSVNEACYVPGSGDAGASGEGNEKVIEGVMGILRDENTHGFIFLLVKLVHRHCTERGRRDGDGAETDVKPGDLGNKTGDKIRYKPILGSVVHVVDENKRYIKMVFCERKISYDVANKLLRVSLGRILIHSVLWSSKNRVRNGGSNKVICIYDEDILLFPIQAYEILIKEANMSAHWEESGEVELGIGGESKSVSSKYSETLKEHSDYSSADNCNKYFSASKCQCLGRFSNNLKYKKFWEITESRLSRLIRLNSDIFGTSLTCNDFVFCRPPQDRHSNILNIDHSGKVKFEEIDMDNCGFSGHNRDSRSGVGNSNSNQDVLHTPIRKRRRELQ